MLSSIPKIYVHHSTVLLSPSPTTSGPTPTDPQDNNIEFTSHDSLNTLSLFLIAVSSLLTIIILLLLSSFVLVKWCKGRKQNGTVNMCFQAPAPTTEEPFYDSVKDRPEANNSIPSSAVPSQSNPAYGIRAEAGDKDNIFQMRINSGYGVMGHIISSTQLSTDSVVPENLSSRAAADIERCISHEYQHGLWCYGT
ncbi:hypothetical protein GBAR_LOCUS13738 [Geodia barretti]|uniref:Uncharacterized protein n=1 Tax=Geodia barretti TaxID=519541 RepID=A0AA35S4Y8_GEOBA|nr:hypothetical protein GBAR_LOCUS13738 [Geodia barretti]